MQKMFPIAVIHGMLFQFSMTHIKDLAIQLKEEPKRANSDQDKYQHLDNCQFENLINKS